MDLHGVWGSGLGKVYYEVSASTPRSQCVSIRCFLCSGKFPRRARSSVSLTALTMRIRLIRPWGLIRSAILYAVCYARHVSMANSLRTWHEKSDILKHSYSGYLMCLVLVGHSCILHDILMEAACWGYGIRDMSHESWVKNSPKLLLKEVYLEETVPGCRCLLVKMQRGSWRHDSGPGTCIFFWFGHESFFSIPASIDIQFDIVYIRSAEFDASDLKVSPGNLTGFGHRKTTPSWCDIDILGRSM